MLQRSVLFAALLTLSSVWGTVVQAQTVFKEFYDGVLFVKVTDDKQVKLPIFVNKSVDQAVAAVLASDPNVTGQTDWAQLVQEYAISTIRKAAMMKDPLLDPYYRVEFGRIHDIHKLQEALEALPGVEIVEKEPIMFKLFTPNDHSTGIFSGTPHLAQINAFDAFDFTRGDSNIKVAIVDDAVLITHEDLADNIWKNPGEIPNNGIDDDSNGFVDDYNGYDVSDNDGNPLPLNGAQNGHGTHCAGLAGAVTDNGKGVASIGYGISLMPVKATPDTATQAVIYNGYDGIQYASEAGADVISLSWGSMQSISFHRNIISAVVNRGSVVVAASGNDGVTTAFYPAAYDGVIAVGAVDGSDRKTNYSNYGGYIDLMAPGNVYSTIANSNTSYTYQVGTSMACPMVAGLCGLMLSYNPNLNPAQVEAALKAGCDNIDSKNTSYVGKIGAGRINAGKALRAARPAKCDLANTISSHIGTGTLVIDSASSAYPAGNQDGFATKATAKAQLFEDYLGYNLLSAIELDFEKAVAASGTSKVTVTVWSSTDRGWTPTNPVLGAIDVPISTIAADIQAGHRTKVTFATPFEVKGKFYAGITFGNDPGDTVVLAAEKQTALFSNNGWERIGGNWGKISARWGYDVSLGIYPIMTATEASITASITAPATLNAGTAASFTGNSNSGTLFSWSFSGVARSGKTVSFTFPNPGTYTIVLTASNGKCLGRDTISVTVDAPTSVGQQLNTAPLVLFPNPSQAAATLSSMGELTAKVEFVSVTDVLGREVFSIQPQHNGDEPFSLELPLASLQAGLYFVQIQTPQGPQVIRWVKQ